MTAQFNPIPKVLISVVVPLYNKASFIKRTLDSVLNQTYQPLEIIVVDDGSTDGGGEIVASLANPLVRLIRQDNAGVSAARNRGIQEARGEFIAFLDADDEWRPKYLETICELLLNYPDAGLFATAYIYYSKTQQKKIVNRNYPRMSTIFDKNPFKCYFGDPLFFTSSVVIPKKIFEELGGFPVGIKLSEDIETWLKIGLFSKIAYSPKVMVNYRRDTGINTCDTEINDNPTKLFNSLNSWLIDGKIGPKIIKDYYNFIFFKKISLAKEFIKKGDGKKARQVIKKCHPKGRQFFLVSIILLFSYFSPIVKRI